MIAKDFTVRREKLMNLLPSGSTVIVYGRSVLKRLPTIPVPFNQFSDLYYLTGESRPGGALVITNKNGKNTSTLFLPEPNKERELWDGFRTPFDEAQKRSGVDSVSPFSHFDQWVNENTPDIDRVFCSFPPHQSCHKNFRRLAPFIDQLRVVKDSKEINLIRKACEITRESMDIALRDAKPGVTEFEIASKFELEVWKRGATGLAYPIECQSGDNALCLHYIENKDKLKEGDGLLIDAGCECEHYASDFTRTVAIGVTSAIRRDAIQMVDDMKKSLVTMARNGTVSTLTELNERCKAMAMENLKKLGVSVDPQKLSTFCPHRISHWIGLDVHDSGSVSLDTPLQKGHVFSVEPGIYFPRDADCPAELKGLGIRFEDTVILE